MQNDPNPKDPNAEPAEHEHDKQPGGHDQGEVKDFDPDEEPAEDDADAVIDPKG